MPLLDRFGIIANPEGAVEQRFAEYARVDLKGYAMRSEGETMAGKTKGFWKLEHELLAEILQLELGGKKLGGNKLRVLLALADCTLGYGKKQAVVSAQRLSDITGIARRHVQRALKELEEAGLVGHGGESNQKTYRWVNLMNGAVHDAVPKKKRPRSILEVGLEQS